MTNAVKQLFHQIDRNHLKIHNFIIFGKHLLRVSRPFRQTGVEIQEKKNQCLILVFWFAL